MGEEPEEKEEQCWEKREDQELWSSSPLDDYRPPDELHHRLQTLLLALRQEGGRLLLFVDHFHRLLAGEYHDDPIQAINVLKPVLYRQEVQIMGACTLEQYRLSIEPEASMQRRFQIIFASQ